MTKVRVLGGGWYGCHIASALRARGNKVQLHESSDRLFSGASGNMPGRLHLGFHYPRSRLTRAACQDHYSRFMLKYGHLTVGVPVNIYAIAKHHSMVDFGNYVQSLNDEVEFIQIHDPTEFGLRNVEGALLTGERHTLIRNAREYFSNELGGIVSYGVPSDMFEENDFDLTVDCTFCARDNAGVDRYEPCVTGLMRGDCSRAITIMDGPFPSLYPWDEAEGLVSLTSAKWTPLSKECKTYAEAKEILRSTPSRVLVDRVRQMHEDMQHYFPGINHYTLNNTLTAIRAMPLSGADARLVDIVRMSDRVVRVRASKLDAIFYAEEEICRLLS